MTGHGKDHKEEERTRLWRHAFLVMVIVALPVFYSMVTAQVAFDRSKSLEFCASCHVMTPYVEGLKDPDSTMLAAQHFQNRRINNAQCYTCHVDYDLLGPMRAKVNGLNHMVHYYLTPPREIKLYKPFPNKNCLQCHGDAASFLKSDAHTSILDQLKSDEMSCIDCHGPVHPKTEEKKK